MRPRDVQVRPVTRAGLPAFLPLIADYQRFYADSAAGEDHNAGFFGHFVAPSERGMLIGAYDKADDAPAGYACLYWTYCRSRPPTSSWTTPSA